MAKRKQKFEFSGGVVAVNIQGLEFRHNFSPSAPLDGMRERMEKRIKKVNKIRGNQIFRYPYTAEEKNLSHE